jgi:DnaK suppressor protein
MLYSENEREDFKAILLEKIVEAQKEIADLEERVLPIAPDVAIGRLTRMDAIGSKAIYEAGLASARQNLTQLESAMNRVDREDFGLCAYCNKPIPIKRLLAMPETETCLRCAK